MASGFILGRQPTRSRAETAKPLAFQFRQPGQEIGLGLNPPLVLGDHLVAGAVFTDDERVAPRPAQTLTRTTNVGVKCVAARNVDDGGRLCGHGSASYAGVYRFD